MILVTYQVRANNRCWNAGHLALGSFRQVEMGEDEPAISLNPHHQINQLIVVLRACLCRKYSAADRSIMLVYENYASEKEKLV